MQKKRLTMPVKRFIIKLTQKKKFFLSIMQYYFWALNMADNKELGPCTS